MNASHCELLTLQAPLTSSDEGAKLTAIEDMLAEEERGAAQAAAKKAKKLRQKANKHQQELRQQQQQEQHQQGQQQQPSQLHPPEHQQPASLTQEQTGSVQAVSEKLSQLQVTDALPGNGVAAGNVLPVVASSLAFVQRTADKADQLGSTGKKLCQQQQQQGDTPNSRQEFLQDLFCCPLTKVDSIL